MKLKALLKIKKNAPLFLSIASVLLVFATFQNCGRKFRFKFNEQNLKAQQIRLVSAGAYHTCEIKQGALYCFGYNESGQLGDGTTTYRTSPVLVGGLLAGQTVTAVSTGYGHTCATISSGSLYCFGYNGSGQLGDATTTQRTSPVLVGGLLAGQTVTSVSAGNSHTCAIASSGSLYCFGSNWYGQLGDGTTTDSTSPVLVGGLLAGQTVTSVSAGGYHTCALISSGSLYCFGNNGSGQLGDGTTTDSTSPVLVGGLLAGQTVTSVSAGGYHTCAIVSNGSLYCFGSNWYGQLGDASTTQRTSPVLVGGLLAGQTVTAVSTGYSHTCAIASSGSLYCFGSNWYGQLGDGTTTDSTSPVLVGGLLAGQTVTAVSAGDNHTCTTVSSGSLYCFGDDEYGQLSDPARVVLAFEPNQITSSALQSVSHISASNHTCAIASSGALYCFGSNWYGQLGDGTTTDSTSPVLVGGLLAGQTVTAVSAGDHHTCATISSGLLYCFGNNGSGQLGDATTTQRTSPVLVGGLLAGQTVIAVSVGNNHTCALVSSGLLYCFGYNGSSQLGDATTTQRTSPVLVGGLLAGQTVTSVSAGGYHTCALVSSSSLYCFGANWFGQLGIGSEPMLLIPLLVP